MTEQTHVWHDASEPPDNHRTVFVQSSVEQMKACYDGEYDEWLRRETMIPHLIQPRPIRWRELTPEEGSQ